ncbi:MAG: T9SS type A sorting domain-containing protein [Saprospiraceae bacterium]|nr:T9SS type A sorting domain-containing protein [Saprospiraceae bacterium]
MKPIFFTFLFLVFSLHGRAQGIYPPTIWTSGVTALDPGIEDSGLEFLDIAVTPGTSDDVYAVAVIYSPVNVNGITVMPDEENGTSMLLLKYNLNGEFQWLKNLGYLGESIIHICAGSNGQVFLTSSMTVEEINFGNGVSVLRACLDGCQEMFVACLNGNGQALWAKSVSAGSNAYLASAGIATNPAGNVVVGGNYEGTSANFGPGFDFNNLAEGGFFLAVYNAANGTPQAVQFLASDSDPADLQHLAINPNGVIVLSGSFSGNLKFANGVGINTTGFFDGFVAGLSPGGAAQWAKSVTSSDYLDILGIDIDDAGNAYLAIDASTDLRLDNSLILNINNAYAGVVLKVGSTLFSLPVVIEYPTSDYAVMDAKLDHWGNIYTIGYLSEPVPYGPNKAAIDGCVDGFMTGTSNEGLPQWSRTVGGSGCEGLINGYYGAAIAIDDAGFMYCTGLFIEGFSEDGISIPGAGGFISKFNTSIVDTDEPGSLVPMQIAPNPSTGNFAIQLASMPPANTEFLLYNMQGSIVYRQAVTAEQTEVQTDLPTGVYSAVLRNGARMERFKLIVQRG